MKRKMILLAALLLCLTGCGRDTMIYIPAEPEWVVEVTVSGGQTEAPETAEPVTEAVTEATSAAEIRVVGSATSKKKQTTSSGGSSKVTATEKPTEKPTTAKPVETKPAETKPAETKPVETKPVETKPVETKPAEAKPMETEPPETKPVATEPAATEAPATQPSTTEPAATEAPETEPPETEPVVTEPPATQPPATEPPATEPPVTEPPETEPPLYDISGYTVGNLEYEILDRINEYRAQAELEEMELDEWLCAIGSCRGYESSLVWSHTRPDGRSYATALPDYGYSAASVKELLVYVYGAGDGAGMVDKWMSSDSHRELLLGDYTTLGVGVYKTNGFTYVACLVIR